MGALTASQALRPPRLPAALLLLALALFTIGLGQGTLWDQDEPKYADIARQIIVRGDPLTLYHNGQPWFVHPPLYKWLLAGTGALFGFSEFTVRIWTALFGAAGVLVTFLLARRLYDALTAFLAGLILMTTLEYFVLSRLAIFDVVLVSFMLIALERVLAAEEARTRDDERRAYRWAFVWSGFATLTKGPIGLLLPAMVVGVWWLGRGVLRRRLRALPWEGFPPVRSHRPVLVCRGGDETRPSIFAADRWLLHDHPLLRCGGEPARTLVLLPPRASIVGGAAPS